MDAIREELLLLRSSLIEEEFVWDLPALAVEAWEARPPPHLTESC